MDQPHAFTPDTEASRILAAIVESSDDAIIGKDLRGIILTWNQGAERLYGYTADEVRGRSVALLIPDHLADELPDILRRVSAGDRVESHETVRRTKDGRLLEVAVTVSPIADASGRVVGAATIARDITARKAGDRALRASELRWRSIVESAVDGIVVIDQQGHIEAFNPAAERLFGFTEAEVLGQNITIIMPEPDRSDHDGYLERHQRTGVANIIGRGREVMGRRRDGSVFRLHLSVGEMADGEQRRYTGILHDLTARLRMEDQLLAQAALAGLGEMAAVIAHEVRNPIAGIRGAIQVIGGRLPPDSRDAAVTKEIVARLDGLNDLVNDLLQFARPTTPRPEPVDLAALVRKTATLAAADPAIAGVTIEVRGEAVPVMADRSLVEIVFFNLLLNGAQAMHGQGVLNVVVEALDATCTVTFEDRGPGIPADLREKVFTPFFTTKSAGSGLGLPTARRLVEAHGGTIDLACPPAGGTVVTVRFPAHS
ncbi:MAG: PAS domain S-box protein [Vicinamibacterales bacterium]